MDSQNANIPLLEGKDRKNECIDNSNRNYDIISSENFEQYYSIYLSMDGSDKLKDVAIRVEDVLQMNPQSIRGLNKNNEVMLNNTRVIIKYELSNGEEQHETLELSGDKILEEEEYLERLQFLLVRAKNRIYRYNNDMAKDDMYDEEETCFKILCSMIAIVAILAMGCLVKIKFNEVLLYNEAVGEGYFFIYVFIVNQHVILWNYFNLLCNGSSVTARAQTLPAVSILMRDGYTMKPAAENPHSHEGSIRSKLVHDKLYEDVRLLIDALCVEKTPLKQVLFSFGNELPKMDNQLNCVHNTSACIEEITSIEDASYVNDITSILCEILNKSFKSRPNDRIYEYNSDDIDNLVLGCVMIVIMVAIAYVTNYCDAIAGGVSDDINNLVLGCVMIVIMVAIAYVANLEFREILSFDRKSAESMDLVFAVRSIGDVYENRVSILRIGNSIMFRSDITNIYIYDRLNCCDYDLARYEYNYSIASQANLQMQYGYIRDTLHACSDEWRDHTIGRKWDINRLEDINGSDIDKHKAGNSLANIYGDQLGIDDERSCHIYDGNIISGCFAIDNGCGAGNGDIIEIASVDDIDFDYSISISSVGILSVGNYYYYSFHVIQYLRSYFSNIIVLLVVSLYMDLVFINYYVDLWYSFNLLCITLVVQLISDTCDAIGGDDIDDNDIKVYPSKLAIGLSIDFRDEYNYSIASHEISYIFHSMEMIVNIFLLLYAVLGKILKVAVTPKWIEMESSRNRYENIIGDVSESELIMYFDYVITQLIQLSVMYGKYVVITEYMSQNLSVEECNGKYEFRYSIICVVLLFANIKIMNRIISLYTLSLFFIKCLWSVDILLNNICKILVTHEFCETYLCLQYLNWLHSSQHKIEYFTFILFYTYIYVYYMYGCAQIIQDLNKEAHNSEGVISMEHCEQKENKLIRDLCTDINGLDYGEANYNNRCSIRYYGSQDIRLKKQDGNQNDEFQSNKQEDVYLMVMLITLVYYSFICEEIGSHLFCIFIAVYIAQTKRPIKLLCAYKIEAFGQGLLIVIIAGIICKMLSEFDYFAGEELELTGPEELYAIYVCALFTEICAASIVFGIVLQTLSSGYCTNYLVNNDEDLHIKLMIDSLNLNVRTQNGDICCLEWIIGNKNNFDEDSRYDSCGILRSMCEMVSKDKTINLTDRLAGIEKVIKAELQTGDVKGRNIHVLVVKYNELGPNDGSITFYDIQNREHDLRIAVVNKVLGDKKNDTYALDEYVEMDGDRFMCDIQIVRGVENDTYGFVVRGIVWKHGKLYYQLRNIFDNSEMVVNKGHIELFMMLIRSPIKMLENTTNHCLDHRLSDGLEREEFKESYVFILLCYVSWRSE